VTAPCVRIAQMPLARSSSGQSARLIHERQEVQVLPGQLDGSSGVRAASLYLAAAAGSIPACPTPRWCNGKHHSLLRSRVRVRVLGGALRVAGATGQRRRLLSARLPVRVWGDARLVRVTGHPPRFQRGDAGSSPARAAHAAVTLMARVAGPSIRPSRVRFASAVLRGSQVGKAPAS
jgi:hypothetical protein